MQVPPALQSPLLKQFFAGALLQTPCSRTPAGIGAMGRVGSGTNAMFGAPFWIAPSGRARVYSGRWVTGLVRFAGKPSSPRMVPGSNTSWTRHSDHMPEAK